MKICYQNIYYEVGQKYFPCFPVVFISTEASLAKRLVVHIADMHIQVLQGTTKIYFLSLKTNMRAM